MTVPLDGIRAFHNAFRKDMKIIDTAAKSAASGRTGQDPNIYRYVLFNEILMWHAGGEEEFVFTALENVAPLVAEAYERDHRGLDALFISLNKAVKSNDILETARATKAFDFFLDFHLGKEEAHLYRTFNDRIPIPDQWTVIGKISAKIPQERFPEVVNWLFPLISTDDRENMIRIFQRFFPAPALSGVTQLIKTSIGDEWVELQHRIPELDPGIKPET